MRAAERSKSSRAALSARRFSLICRASASMRAPTSRRFATAADNCASTSASRACAAARFARMLESSRSATASSADASPMLRRRLCLVGAGAVAPCAIADPGPINPMEQARNATKNRFITRGGLRLCLDEAPQTDYCPEHADACANSNKH